MLRMASSIWCFVWNLVFMVCTSRVPAGHWVCVVCVEVEDAPVSDAIVPMLIGGQSQLEEL